MGAVGRCVPGGGEGEGGGVLSSCCGPLVKVCRWLVFGLWLCWLDFTLQKLQFRRGILGVACVCQPGLYGLGQAGSGTW
jgi:hypothetical protein